MIIVTMVVAAMVVETIVVATMVVAASDSPFNMRQAQRTHSK